MSAAQLQKLCLEGSEKASHAIHLVLQSYRYCYCKSIRVSLIGFRRSNFMSKVNEAQWVMLIKMEIQGLFL